METDRPRSIGFELHFENSEPAGRFYIEILGLELSEEMKEEALRGIEQNRQTKSQWAKMTRGGARGVASGEPN
jgi:hypothetical protein